MLLAGVIYFAFNEDLLITLLLFGLIIFAGILRIHGLSISQKGINIRRYNAFGFKKRELVIPHEKLHDIQFWEHGNLNYADSTDTWLDILFIPALFLANKKGITFKIPLPESDIKCLKIHLDNREYELVRKLVQQPNRAAYKL